MENIEAALLEFPAGVQYIQFKNIADDRGTLCIAQQDCLPFRVERIFWIHSVPPDKERGSHAHRTCSEILVPLGGSFKLTVTDGNSTATLLLNNPSIGILIPPMVWCQLSDFTTGCVCMCMASENYDESGYINNFEDFIKEVNEY